MPLRITRDARRKGQHGDADRLALDSAAAERQAREATAKAQGIEDAIYDLKAVNPREVKQVDARTPAQLLAAIEAKGHEVDAALARLKALVEPMG